MGATYLYKLSDNWHLFQLVRYANNTVLLEDVLLLGVDSDREIREYGPVWWASRYVDSSIPCADRQVLVFSPCQLATGRLLLSL